MFTHHTQFSVLLYLLFNMGPIQYLAAIVAYTAAMTIASVLPHDYSPRGDNGPHLNCGKTDLPPLGNDQPVFDLIARYCRSYRAHSTHWGNYVDPNSYDAVSCFASDKSALTYFSINIDKPENQPDSILPNESQCNVMFRDAYMTCMFCPSIGDLLLLTH